MKILTFLFISMVSVGLSQKKNSKTNEGNTVSEFTKEQKDSMVRNVYDRIYLASGEFKVKPKLTVSDKKSQGASYTPSIKTPTIYVESEALEVCLEMGLRRDDAMAFLLSHEIGHHFTYDFWNGNYEDFDIKFKDSLLSKYGIESSKDNNQRNTIRTLQEIKADEKGGILRYMAGYSSENLAEKFLEALYNRYPHFTDTMKCYPPIQERIKISKIADERAQGFVNIFETATFAVVLKNYDWAIKQYNSLIVEFDFHSREIYNNLGVVHYLRAMELSDEREVKFIYPVEIDLNSRIKTQNGIKGLDPRAIENLNNAIFNFKKATDLDPTYATGFLNMACMYALLGEDYDAAKSNAKKALKISHSDAEKQNARLVLAIIDLLSGEGDEERGKASIDFLAAKGNEFGILNKSILEGKKWSELVFTRPLNSSDALNESINITNTTTTEKISGLNKVNEIYEANYLYEESFKYGSPVVTLNTYHLKSAKIQLLEDRYLLLTTKSNYADSTVLGIHLNSSVKELTDKYGLPTMIMPAAQGWIYHYPKSEMIVVLNADMKVSKWMVYRQL